MRLSLTLRLSCLSSTSLLSVFPPSLSCPCLPGWPGLLLLALGDGSCLFHTCTLMVPDLSRWTFLNVDSRTQRIWFLSASKGHHYHCDDEESRAPTIGDLRQVFVPISCTKGRLPLCLSLSLLGREGGRFQDLSPAVKEP